MSKDISSMLECVSMTTDGKKVIGGVYSFYETTGLPLDVIFEHLRTKNSVVSWIDFYKDAIKAGMRHTRVLSKLEESICDVWGKAFYDVVEDKLNLIFSSDPVHRQRAKEIFESNKVCQLEEMSKQNTVKEHIEEEQVDISFPCAKCNANMNIRCRTKIHGPHKRLRSPAWLVERRKQDDKRKQKTLSTSHETMVLCRPVNGLEYHLIRQLSNNSFPPRFEHQFIFYPISNEEHAAKIAKEWSVEDNTTSFVVRFKVRTAYISMFDLYTVGNKEHQEYRISSSDMDRLNRNIVGQIETIHVFRGKH